MVKLSDSNKGDELQEKLEVLEKMYKKMKRSSEEENFFDNFRNKYQQIGGSGIEDFSRQLKEMCNTHENYLRGLLSNSGNPYNELSNLDLSILPQETGK